MTQLEFWGCAFISFGLPLAMFIFTIAKDPLRIIVFVARFLVYFKIFLQLLCTFNINFHCLSFRDASTEEFDLYSVTLCEIIIKFSDSESHLCSYVVSL